MLAPYASELLEAAALTILLSVATIALATLVALPLAVLSNSAPAPIRVAVAAYSWVLRAVPALVLLFLVYYGLPTVGITFPALPTAIVGLAITGSAYNLEVFRTGILAVHRSQFEAARALGLPFRRTWGRIIIPQMLATVVPPYFSNATLMIKGTSIASIITVTEITGVTSGIASLTYRPLEPLGLAALVYLGISSVMNGLQAKCERLLAESRHM